MTTPAGEVLTGIHPGWGAAVVVATDPWGTVFTGVNPGWGVVVVVATDRWGTVGDGDTEDATPKAALVGGRPGPPAQAEAEATIPQTTTGTSAERLT